MCVRNRFGGHGLQRIRHSVFIIEITEIFSERSSDDSLISGAFSTIVRFFANQDDELPEKGEHIAYF